MSDADTTLDPDSVARTQLIVGIIAVIVGLVGYWVARDAPFSGGSGAIIFNDFELRTMSYNRLGALLTIAFGATGILAAVVRRPVIGLVGAVGFVLLAIQPLVSARPGAENLVAATGRNWGFALAMALGVGVPALLVLVPAGRDTPSIGGDR